MAVTIQQIAKEAGVSRGTVDRALNGRGRIKPEVAENIRRIAAELGYVPKHPKAAGQGTPDRPLRIGVVTQLCRSSFMLQINQGIADAKKKLAKRGIEILLEENETVDEDEQLASIRRLEETGIDGLAIMPVDSDGIRTKLQQLTRNDLPVITFNTDIVGTGRRCFVGLDNRKSGQTAAGLMGLMTQEQGKILVITGYFSNRTGSLRVDGFVEELKRSFPQMELVGVQSSFDQSKEVEDILVHALEAFPDLAGVFVASGGQAGVRRAFERVQPKKRPYVILYDRTPRNEEQLRDRVADFLIDQEGYEQGYRAVLMLADLLQNHKSPEKEYCYTEISIKTRYNLT